MNDDLEQQPVNQSRRRLAKGGVAASIILSSLASKGALAIPYRCTVSGKVSGNPSGPGVDQSTCDVGHSPTEWSTAHNDSGSGGTFNGTTPSIMTTALFTALGFHDEYHLSVDGNTIVPAATPSTTTATLLQVLTKPASGGMTTDKLDFGRMAIATYLNAVSVLDFPLTTAQVIGMFNDTVNGGTYSYDGAIDIVMDQAEVKNYFAYLYTNNDAFTLS